MDRSHKFGYWPKFYFGEGQTGNDTISKVFWEGSSKSDWLYKNLWWNGDSHKSRKDQIKIISVKQIDLLPKLD